jgi:dTDP-glucose 4,6-dehydratase
MRIIITGGAGFIGSAAVRHAIRAGHDVLTLDKLTYAGRLGALNEVSSSQRHRFLRGDIADQTTVRRAFDDHDPDIVLHLAAESHVDRSIDAPGAFISSNIVGTFVLLECALQHWSQLAPSRRESFRFVHVSTDEVFGSLPATGAFTSQSPYAPNSPYAASKASADHLVRAWHRTYGLPIIVTNCSNNYGPWQHHEKLIPVIIRSALSGVPIPIYGTGLNIRDWIYCEDHVAGLFAAIYRGKAGQTHLFGGRSEATNLDIAQAICGHLDQCRPLPRGRSYATQINFVADRPGHDHRYAVDSSASERELDWRPTEQLKSGLAKTVDWFLANPTYLAPHDDGVRLGTRNMQNLIGSDV